MHSSGWLELLSGEVRIPLRGGRLFDREPRSRSRQRCGTLDRRRQTCAMLSRPGGGYPSVSKGSVAWLTSIVNALRMAGCPGDVCASGSVANPTVFRCEFDELPAVPSWDDQAMAGAQRVSVRERRRGIVFGNDVASGDPLAEGAGHRRTSAR